jgi:predicted RNA polymerase sigma factor
VPSRHLGWIEGELARYQRLPAARAELLQALGRFVEARLEFERAASLTRTPAASKARGRAAACVRP